MSDHDASPKEWTSTHSIRHGPQQWLTGKRRRWTTNTQTISTLIGATTTPQPHQRTPTILKHHTLPESFTTSTTSSSDRTRLTRRSLPLHLTSSSSSTPSSESKEADEPPLNDESIVNGPEVDDIAEEEHVEEEDESASDEMSDSNGTNYHSHYGFAHRHGRAKSQLQEEFQRIASVPLEASVDSNLTSPTAAVAVSSSSWRRQNQLTRSFSDVEINSAGYLQWQAPHASHIQQHHCATCMQVNSTAQSAPPATSSSDALNYSTLSAQTSFSPYRPTDPQLLPPSSSRSNLVQSDSKPPETILLGLPPFSAQAPSQPQAQPPPPPPPPSAPSSTVLPRWFLIALAILKETDGRDKIAKVIQYGGRALRNTLQLLPNIIWWFKFLWKNLQEGHLRRMIQAVKLITLRGSDTLKAVSSIPTVATFSTTLMSNYTTETLALSERLAASPIYAGTMSRLETLTAALSSARRVIRVCKWTYTLPGWCKTFDEWRKQVAEGIEKDLIRRQKEEEEKAAALDRADSALSTTVTNSSTSSTPTKPVTPAAPFRFSHPHPTHVWHRLPWLSSVELLDLTIAVATDCADDLELLSKYQFFPGELGYKCGRISMIAWFITVVLDLALTFRILRHYHYQRRELLTQIKEVTAVYETGSKTLATYQLAREEKAYRRLARELKSSPQKKKREIHPDAQLMADSINLNESAVQSAPASGSMVLVSTIPSSSSSVTNDGSSSSVPQPLTVHQPTTESIPSSMSSSLRRDVSSASWSVLSDPNAGATRTTPPSDERPSSTSSQSDGVISVSDDNGHRSNSDSNRSSGSNSVHEDAATAANANPTSSQTSSNLTPDPPQPPLSRPHSLHHPAQLHLHHTDDRCPGHASHLDQEHSACPAEDEDSTPSSSSEDEANDNSSAARSHAATVDAYHRLTDLHHQLAATRVSLWLQYLNFAKFAADFGCALPMALNVHKQWDGVVQTTGLLSGALGLYKLAITIKPAS